MNIELSTGLPEAWQWDTNLKLRISDEIPEAHFRFDGKAGAVDVEDGWVEIPNELLQKTDDIEVWTYDSEHTMDFGRITVRGRPKPDTYVYTPTEVKRWENLDERIAALEAANVQPNWNQNDASAADYVRGRTHYVGTKHDVRTINQHSGKFSPELGLVIGNTYQVAYDSGTGFGDGVEFVCKDFNDGKDGTESAPYIGNAYENGDPNPYLIFNNNIELHFGFSHVVAIRGWKIEGDFADIKTLDTKYLDPGLLERIAALEQGGIVSGVSSVNGKTGAVELTAEDVGAATPEEVASAVEAAAETLQPKGDYITQDKLQSATDAALAQAKASGEFDGPQGPQGPKGDTGTPGTDGTPGIVISDTEPVGNEHPVWLLPDGSADAEPWIPNPEKAAVGQTIRVAAVDADGRPTEWELVDVPDDNKKWVKIVDLEFSSENSPASIKDTGLQGVTEFYIVAKSLENSATSVSGFSLLINSALVVESGQAIYIGKSGSALSQRTTVKYNGIHWDAESTSQATNNPSLRTMGTARLQYTASDGVGEATSFELRANANAPVSGTLEVWAR